MAAVYRDVPQDAIEIQEMSESTPVNHRPTRNGQARNGSLKRSRSAGSLRNTLKRTFSTGSLRRGKHPPRRPDSGNSQNGLIYDDEYDDDDFDYDLDFTRGQRIRNVMICVFIAAAVVVTIVVVAVTLTGGGPNTRRLGFLPPDDMNYTRTVELNCTPVRGYIEDDVFQFLGIPYAAPPLMNRRWKEPQSLEASPEGCYNDDVIEADEFGAECYQYDQVEREYMGMEDCLYLNVWTPDLSNTSNLEVMVYFHGGGFMTGSGSEPGASPNAALAKSTNMVYVSFNYRLNALGFVSLDVLSKLPNRTKAQQGNFGLLDQIMVLKWVQKNIKHFGGDPTKVTLFGQGSGATSILILLSLPETKGLYRGAWLMSPSPKFEGNSQADVKNQNQVFLNGTKCLYDAMEDVELVACLKSIHPSTLLQALPWNRWLNRHFRDLPGKAEKTAMIPIVDGKLVQRTVIEGLKWNQANDVPLLIGSMAQEIDDNPLPANLSKWDCNTYDNYVRSKLQSAFAPRIIRELLAKYPCNGRPEYQFTSMVSDMRAICPLDEVAKVAASFLDSDVHRYVMTYTPVKNITMQNETRNYAFGGLDMHSFFGAYDKISGYASVADSAVTKYLRDVVTRFAKGEELDSGWKSFPQATNIISATSQSPKSGVYKKEECDFIRNSGFFPEYAWMN